MCGICGIIQHSGNIRIEEDALRRMCGLMRHRGPDDEGVYMNGSGKPAVGLGHRRLNIIDLSSAGHQPMSNEDGSIWIVFNGEVYNFQEFRPSLVSRGHKFRSNSDTEVVIHLYEEHGEDCLKYISGMFAFAIWDEKKGSLFCARDRPGKKPFLYTNRNGRFCFASEFESLLSCGSTDKSVNSEALYYYFTFGYIPAPLTIYQDIFKLPPAHSLVLKDGQITLKKYWELDFSLKRAISQKEAAEEVLRLLREAVKVRMYSDVPLGAFLSGGVDSSAVVGLMSELSSKRVKTFSIGFEESDYSELKFARTIARKFNTEHNEFIVRPRALEILPLLVQRYGEPYADSSCVPTYYVSRETRRFVTVALNGDGGDELFAGYDRYQAMVLASKFQDMPVFFRRLISSCALLLPDSLDSKNNFRRIKRFIAAAGMPFLQRYLKWISIMDDELKLWLLNPGFLKSVSLANPSKFLSPCFGNDRGAAIVDSLLQADTRTYLPNDLLVKVDIVSMANSLEARSPFLDHRLMEFAASLPEEYKIHGQVKKYILKKAIGGFIPKENIYRRKMGFGVPIGRWLRGELQDYMRENLLSTRSLSRGYYRPDVVKDMITMHVSGRRDLAFQLWSMLMLELWHQKFMD